MMIIISLFFVEIVIFVQSKCYIVKTLQPLLQCIWYSHHGKLYLMIQQSASLIYLEYFFIHIITVK